MRITSPDQDPRMLVYLIRPHPPARIRRRRTPVAESYRYDWEPIGLRVIAYSILEQFADSVRLKLWHLMDCADDRRMLAAARRHRPAILFFSEMDILVNEVSRLAGRIKTAMPGCWTVAGGKQSSLLRPGDRFPFEHVDFCVRGDGCRAAPAILRVRLDGSAAAAVPGVIRPDRHGRCVGPSAGFPRADISDIDGIRLRATPVEGHDLSEYLERRHDFPSCRERGTRTATIYTGVGCAHSCTFCQSPAERVGDEPAVRLRRADLVAREIAWLHTRHGANNFFALEANLCLENLRSIYIELAKLGLKRMPLAGFVRAGDVARAGRSGLLKDLADRGLRFLSIGLDVPPDSRRDVYCKEFSYQEQSDCLAACLEAGIVVLPTFIADPELTAGQFEAQLEMLASLPVGTVDIRVAMALRNTPYFDRYRQCLTRDPDRDPGYFDRQNYRYQSIRVPGRISPAATYRLIREFQDRFPFTRAHIDYVATVVGRRPVFVPYFRRQYRAALDASDPRLRQLADLLPRRHEP